MRYLLILILFYGFISCGNQRLTFNDVVGEYQWKGEREGTGEINLKSDSTFLYTFHIGLLNIDVHGNWNLTKGAIILNSQFQKNSSFEAFGKVLPTTKNHKGMEIQINNVHGEPIPCAKYIAYSKGDSLSAGISDFQGNVFLKHPEIDSISLGIMGKLPFNYKIPTGINSIVVELFDLNVLIHYRYFANEKWSLTKKGLLDSEWNQNYRIKRNNNNKVSEF